MTLRKGSTVGHYRIVGPLGAGGMGEVYRAHDENLDRDVAVKVLPDAVANDADALERFEGEARTVAALSHPNILTIHDFGREEGVAYAVIELLEGEDLKARLERDRVLGLDEALRIGRAIALGLAAAHQRGVVHRDIKPANVFLTEAGEVKILDFGLARSGGAPAVTDDSETLVAKTQPGTVMGTVGYMAPEQARGQPARPASDVFAFGCVLYEMLSGRQPFDRGSSSDTLAAILRDQPKPPEEVRSPEGRALGPILERCLQKTPEDRFSTGAELSSALEQVAEARELEAVAGTAALHWLRRPAVLVPLVLILIFAGLALFRARSRASDQRWAREEALPRIEELADRNDFLAAFELTEEVERILPSDPRLAALQARVSTPMTITTEPPGADVSYKPYDQPDAPWRELGATPLEEVVLPRGPFRWRVELAGYESREFARRVPRRDLPAEEDRIGLLLDAEGEIEPGMVPVEAGPYLLVPLTGFPVAMGQQISLRRFWIDRTEVTNAAFLEFVEAGGYTREELWQEPFVDGGETLSFADAIDRFRDQTGRPGPATWSVGAFPAGADELPVGGVSWFEAVAYCRFRDGELPSIVHWIRAVLPGVELGEPMSPSIVPASNFGNKGPVAVGSLASLGGNGTFDQAGNVREWASNARGPEERFVLGGAWTDPSYRFSQADAQNSWERREANGLRCARYVDGPPAPELLAPFALPTADFRATPTVPDAVVTALARPLRYDPTPLNASPVEREETTDRVLERVEVDGPDADGRMAIRLHLPARGTPPYQAIVVAPGLDMTFAARYEDLALYSTWSSLVRSGRVLVEPTYTDTMERGDGSASVRVGQVEGGNALAMAWARDVSRTLDYLESRDDIDHDGIGFFGFSLGAVIGSRILPHEPRLRAAVFVSGGVAPGTQGDTLLAIMAGIRHAKAPLLMLNGRYDTTFPSGTHAQPLIDEWGAADEDKRIVFYEAGHHPLPPGEVLRESLEWYDRYLGPVDEP